MTLADTPGVAYQARCSAVSVVMASCPFQNLAFNDLRVSRYLITEVAWERDL